MVRNYIQNNYRKITGHQHYDKVLHWTKLISVTGASQVIVQATGLVTGLILVWLLPTREYAYYTIANAMLGTMTVLADGGISTGVMAEGGKVWQNKKKLGAILNTGLFLRKKFAIYSLLVTLPILVFLLLRQNAPLLSVVLVVLAIIPAFWAALSDSLLETILKLHQAIPPLQKNQTIVSIFRLALSGMLALLFPFTAVALLGNGIPRVLGNIRLKKIALNYADGSVAKDDEVQKSILHIVKRTLPGSIYFCLSGQITIWLLSLFGNTNALANIGALGRISVAFSFITVLISTLLIPRYARIHDNKGLILKWFLFIFAVALGAVLMAIFFVSFFSDFILSLLGSQYKNLNYELVLSVAGGGLSLLAGVAFMLFTSRGWVINPLTMILINLIAILVFAITFNVSGLQGVLYFNIGTNLVMFLVNFVYGLLKISDPYST